MFFYLGMERVEADGTLGVLGGSLAAHDPRGGTGEPTTMPVVVRAQRCRGGDGLGGGARGAGGAADGAGGGRVRVEQCARPAVPFVR